MGESHILDLGDVHLHYIEAVGPTPILLLLHGFTDSIVSYLPLIPQLATFTHVYAVDFRGHGQSSHTPHQYTLHNHVHDIKRFIDTLIKEPVVIAGHSMGGLVAGWLAALHPDSVRAIIIEDQTLDTPPNDPHPAFAKRREQLAKFKASGKTIQEVATIISNEPSMEDASKTRLEVYGSEGVYRHATQWLQVDLTHFDRVIEGTHVEGWMNEEILPHIRCPSLFITDNSWTDDEAIQSLQYNLSTIEDSKHDTIDIHNHRVHEMRPNAYFHEVERFLKPLIAPKK